ncbi:hypothetical protein GNI_059790 [Gregarina niphandrodes]|uniref:Uncharacterized protein n=1 Tax=Gregarina niphandrodes TaxID=110365 RepID=A0A023B8E9_GRENI|nr:hypothetical protein GNI_059790 [Gregarina niphandrodes]EZG69106.1 hypothetical protein GNI_059790 [Gregarina niphandrodes]|eukprot:XP_011134486.1 hypothetical protein GNI_059790 [Gregarina niphandrodes]
MKVLITRLDTTDSNEEEDDDRSWLTDSEDLDPTKFYTSNRTLDTDRASGRIQVGRQKVVKDRPRAEMARCAVCRRLMNPDEPQEAMSSDTNHGTLVSPPQHGSVFELPHACVSEVPCVRSLCRLSSLRQKIFAELQDIAPSAGNGALWSTGMFILMIPLRRRDGSFNKMWPTAAYRLRFGGTTLQVSLSRDFDDAVSGDRIFHGRFCVPARHGISASVCFVSGASGGGSEWGAGRGSADYDGDYEIELGRDKMYCLRDGTLSNDLTCLLPGIELTLAPTLATLGSLHLAYWDEVVGTWTSRAFQAPELSDEKNKEPQTSVPQTSVLQTSVPQTSVPQTSARVLINTRRCICRVYRTDEQTGCEFRLTEDLLISSPGTYIITESSATKCATV